MRVPFFLGHPVELPAALKSLPEVLSRPDALDALIFLSTLANSALVIFQNSKFVPGVTYCRGSRSDDGIFSACRSPILQKKLLNSFATFLSPFILLYFCGYA